jgi:hypothetical protein
MKLPNDKSDSSAILNGEHLMPIYESLFRPKISDTNTFASE